MCTFHKEIYTFSLHLDAKGKRPYIFCKFGCRCLMQECASPFDYCDVVTSTTHKSLRGPRGGIIFYRKGTRSRKNGEGNIHFDEEKINFAVFPALQGGPHNNHIAALAIALKQVATPEYKAYMQQVKKNAKALASALLRRKCKLVTGGTDNHLFLWDLTALGLAGISIIHVQFFLKNLLTVRKEKKDVYLAI